ncbi:MAG: prepilin peptidase [Candidatus Sumerlaeota bacterium]|nr:prepilin peptidase [Candidatus Sumerlaeota bacterium]
MFDFLSPELFPIHLLFVFIFGSLWGSFFGLCIARIPAGQSIVSPGSYCFACGEPIGWRHNIPLISYWQLRRRCYICGTVFGSRHFWIELLSGLLFAWAFWARGYTLTLFISWVFAGLLLVASFTDIDHWIIPDRISLGGTVIGLVLAAIPFPNAQREWMIFGQPAFYRDHLIWEAGPFNMWFAPSWRVGVGNAAVGAAFAYGLMWAIGKIGSLLFRKEAMGGGDVKLFACIGAFLGAVNCVFVLFISSLFGVVIGVALILIGRLRERRLTRKSEPSRAADTDIETLTAGAMDCLFPEDESADRALHAGERAVLLNVLSQTPPKRAFRHHLPFGPYLAAAAYLVMLYHPWITEFVKSYLNFFGA